MYFQVVGIKGRSRKGLHGLEKIRAQGTAFGITYVH
jgi:hypothetical protein